MSRSGDVRREATETRASRRQVADAVVLALAAVAISVAVVAHRSGGDVWTMFVGLSSGLVSACAVYFLAGVR